MTNSTFFTIIPLVIITMGILIIMLENRLNKLKNKLNSHIFVQNRAEELLFKRIHKLEDRLEDTELLVKRFLSNPELNLEKDPYPIPIRVHKNGTVELVTSGDKLYFSEGIEITSIDDVTINEDSTLLPSFHIYWNKEFRTTINLIKNKTTLQFVKTVQGGYNG